MKSKHWALHNVWSLNPLQIEVLDKYYLLYWEPTHFLQQIEFTGNDELLIEREGIKYSLVISGFNLPDCLLDKNVRLSFRKHKDEEFGIVIVKRNLNESVSG